MTSDSPAAASGGAGKTGTLPFDVSVAHQARMYDYLLGGCFLEAHTLAGGLVTVERVSPCRRGGLWAALDEQCITVLAGQSEASGTARRDRFGCE